MGGFTIGIASAADRRLMVEWAADEGWNPGDTDMLAFAATDPAGFLVGRLNGEPQTCISVVRFGPDYGFLGFYIARPAVRGQGYGIQTWRAGMAHLGSRNVGLDGVVAQQGNYRKSGFRSAWTNLRFQGEPPVDAKPPSGVRIVRADTLPFDRIADYDGHYHPADRSILLSLWHDLPGRLGLIAIRDGAIVGHGAIRPSRSAARIGPLHAEDPATATALVAALAAGIGAPVVAIDVPGRNAAAMKLMPTLGLTPAFETARMYTGAEPTLDLETLYGLASLELG